jgi:hypothetical protein
MTGLVSQPTCILVIGAHRSGTSAVARTLGLMGAAEARDLVPANAANPSGYWEAEAVVASHDRFLRAIGSRWDDPRPLPARALASPAADACRAELLAVLRSEFASAPRFVIKDPRLCRLAPLMLDALAAFGARTLVVSPLRAPGEAMRSLAAREGFSRLRCAALWLGHVLEAERLTRGLPRAFIDYAGFRDNPAAAARDLAARLGGLPFDPAAAARIEAYWSAAGPQPPAMPQPTDDPMTMLAADVYAVLAAATASGEPDLTALDAARAAFAVRLRSAAWRRDAVQHGLNHLANHVARKLAKT